MRSTEKPLTPRQIDNTLCWLHYRYYMSTGAVLALLVVTMGLVARRQYLVEGNEWEGIPFQQVQVPCVRSYPMSDQYSYWWVNTYLIDGTERTVASSKGCTAGRQYSVQYRIGQTGYVGIGNQTAAESLPRK